LEESEFAFPEQRKEPINDAKHVRNAIVRFDQVEGVTDAERDRAWRRITAAARKFDVEIFGGRLARAVRGRQGPQEMRQDVSVTSNVELHTRSAIHLNAQHPVPVEPQREPQPEPGTPPLPSTPIPEPPGEPNPIPIIPEPPGTPGMPVPEVPPLTPMGAAR
jgi:hypothetical protein